MIELKLVPIRHDGTLKLSKKQDVLTVNGVEFDFGPLGDGMMLDSHAIENLFIEKAERVGQTIFITVRYPYSYDTPVVRLIEVTVPASKGGAIALPV